MPQTKKTTVVVGMSGGVDSSVAAALLLDQGFEVIGVTMKTYDFDEVGGNTGNETSCCGLDAFNDARMVAVKLGIPHYVVDFTQQFSRVVIDRFVSEYFRGRTPNPCIACNREIKWGELARKAATLGASHIATGHYARICRNGNRFGIARPRDAGKDQTYALWPLGQEALSKTIFPLGDLTKTEVRGIAARYGLKTAQKEESFEICFVADNDYRRFLSERRPGIAEGDLLLDGKVVGKHQGFPFYTIGQRSGIGSHEERMYVTGIDAATNTVSIGPGKALLRRELLATGLNLISRSELPAGTRVEAQIRYKDAPAPATFYPEGSDRFRLAFDDPKRAITPGQSAVIYEGDRLLGGGIIERVLD